MDVLDDPFRPSDQDRAHFGTPVFIPTALNIAQELSGMGWEELGVRGVSIERCLGYLG